MFPLGWCICVILFHFSERYSRFLESASMKPRCVLLFHTINAYLIYRAERRRACRKLKPQRSTNPTGKNHLDEHVFLDIKYWRHLHSSLPSSSLPPHYMLFVFFPFPLLYYVKKENHMPVPQLKGLFSWARTNSSSLVCIVSSVLSIIFTFSIYNLFSVLHMS